MRKTAEQTLRILDGGNHTRDSPWDIREIEVAVAQAFAKITGIKYYQGLKEGMVGLDSVALIEFVDQMPTKDQFGNIYIDLPAEPISFGSRWQHGINHVGPYSGSLARDLETSFKLIHTTTTPIWANTVNQVNVGQQRIELVGTKSAKLPGSERSVSIADQVIFSRTGGGCQNPR